MNRWERKARLEHGAVTRIARRLGTSIAAVSRVLNDRAEDRRIQRAIARAIGEPVEVVFPSAPVTVRVPNEFQRSA